MFLEQQISVLEWFLKDHMTLRIAENAENSAVITGINYILQYSNRKVILLYFWAKKTNKTRNHTDPKLLNGSVERFTKKVESQTGW